MALGLLGVAPCVGAQGRITVAVGDGTPIRVQAGDSFTLPVTIDMSGAAGANLASLTSILYWGSGRLLLDSVTAGSFGTVTSNVFAPEAGVALLSALNATGTTSSTSLATLWFRTFESTGGTHVTAQPYVAGDALGTNVVGLIRARGLDVCVAQPGHWGDVNGDFGVDILDAQQIARFSIGLSVLNASAIRGQGDVTADGNVDIVDAQQIARFAVEAPAVPRVNTHTLVVPEASAILTSSPTASVKVGGQLQLTAAVVDTSGVTLGGCAPITWTSSDTTKATVDQEGVVTGIAVGIPTITASSGGISARIAMSVGVGAVPASMTIVQGDGQYRLDGNYGVKAQVRVVDAQGQAVPGVSVLFTANAGGVVTLKSGAQQSSATVVTDSTGVAEIAGWSGGGTAVPGQTSYDGYVLQTVERVTATVPGLPAVAITGISVQDGISPSICLLNLAGAAYCHGEYVSDALESADSTLGSVPTLVLGGVPMATLSPGFDGMFTCGVARTGDGYCWGWNFAGQLGDGTQTRSNGMRRVAGGQSFVKIVTGYAHACGITTSGRPYCWGLNQHGQLGTGPMGGASSIPLAVSGTDRMLDIATGTSATCGVTTSGDTWCWGQAPFLDSAGAQVAVPRRIQGAPTFTKIALGRTVACGMTASGQINCWGTGGPALGDGSSANRYGSFSTVALPAPAREIWGNWDSFCASTTDRGLYCWGANTLAQIGGVGDGLPHSTPGLVGFVNALRGQMQPFGFCYQDSTNQPFCFGSFAIGDGVPPFGANPPRYVPVPVKWVDGAPNAAASITLVAGGRQSATTGANVLIAPSVLVRDNAGNPVPGASVTFSVTSGGGSITGSVAAADASGIATVGSWTLGAAPGLNLLTATAGAASTSISAQATIAPALFNIVSGNDQIQAGIATGTLSTTGNYPGVLAVRVLDALERPVVGAAVTFAMTAGPNDFFGFPSKVAQTDSAGVASVTWSAHSVGTSTATATVAGLAPLTFTGTSATGIFGLARCELNGARQALCWGDNRRGQVGDGTTTNRTLPTPVSGGLVFTSLAKGAADHSCGLIAGGLAYCWGANSFGQLGDGSTTDRTTPVASAIEFTFTKLVVGPYSTCGLTQIGSIICWGWSSFGLFGDNEFGTIRQPTVIQTGDYTYSDIALGGFHMCAIENGSGQAQCWGNGIGGELGDGTRDIRSTPARVNGGRTFASIATGSFYTCGLTPSGDAYCWGASGNGNVSTPTQVGAGLDFTAIAPANSSYTCGRTTDGQVYCWGFSTNGQLGNGITSGTPLFTPTPVLSGVSFASVSTRSSSACALAASGQPYCWGTNAQGQLGDGTNTSRLTPVAVRWPEGATGTPVSLAINAGNNQTATANAAVAVAPSVVVKDYAGTPLIGTPVTFTVTSGGGTVTSATVTTNGFGIATVGSWILGPTAGTNTLTVTSPGLPTVIFTATGQ